MTITTQISHLNPINRRTQNRQSILNRSRIAQRNPFNSNIIHSVRTTLSLRHTSRTQKQNTRPLIHSRNSLRLHTFHNTRRSLLSQTQTNINISPSLQLTNNHHNRSTNKIPNLTTSHSTHFFTYFSSYFFFLTDSH